MGASPPSTPPQPAQAAETVRADGSEFPVELAITRVKADGRPSFTGYLRDITERKHVEADREEALPASASRWSADASSTASRTTSWRRSRTSLRTPLTSIRGYLQLLLEGEAGELSPEQADFLAVVDRNSERLLQLVGDLLFVARVEARKIMLAREDADLRELVRDCVESARPLAERKGITLNFASEPLPRVLGDRSRLAQLADNLLANAIKFTAAGGRVDVRASAPNGTAVLEMSDTGIGIARADQEKVFERFFRTRAASEQAIQGTGLSLSISKAIAEAHSGSITVESDEGKGTSFRVELPLADRRDRVKETASA